MFGDGTQHPACQACSLLVKHMPPTLSGPVLNLYLFGVSFECGMIQGLILFFCPNMHLPSTTYAETVAPLPCHWHGCHRSVDYKCVSSVSWALYSVPVVKAVSVIPFDSIL